MDALVRLRSRYEQRPHESLLNFRLRLLFRQGLSIFKHPNRFAVIRKEALLYALLGAPKFLAIARSNRLSPLAYRTMQLPEGAPEAMKNAYNETTKSELAFGIYEWVEGILRKIEAGEVTEVSGAEVLLWQRLEERLRGVSAAAAEGSEGAAAEEERAGVPREQGFLAMDAPGAGEKGGEKRSADAPKGFCRRCARRNS